MTSAISAGIVSTTWTGIKDDMWQVSMTSLLISVIQFGLSESQMSRTVDRSGQNQVMDILSKKCNYAEWKRHLRYLLNTNPDNDVKTDCCKSRVTADCADVCLRTRPDQQSGHLQTRLHLCNFRLVQICGPADLTWTLVPSSSGEPGIGVNYISSLNVIKKSDQIAPRITVNEMLSSGAAWKCPVRHAVWLPLVQ